MDKKQNKELHKACSKGDAAAIKKAIESGADINLADKKGNLPLHVAVGAGVWDACKVLLESGADPRLKNTKGQTPSEYAESKKKKPLAQCLREYEAGGGWQSVCKASVAVYTYDNGNWKQVDPGMVSLDLLKCQHPFSYKLQGKVGGKMLIDATLDANLQYTKATETFHNFFQDGSKVWGFNFAQEEEAKNLLSHVETAREEINNPPPPPETPKATSSSSSSSAPSPPAAPAAPAAPPAKTGGGPPPPPPPPAPALTQSAAPAKPMSMAEAIAAKASGGLKSSDSAEPGSPATSSSSSSSLGGGGGGGGGDMLSELTNRLKKRPQVAKAAEVGAGAGGGGVVTATSESPGFVAPSQGQLDQFKESLLAGFRQELEAAKSSIIDQLVHEIQSLP